MCDEVVHRDDYCRNYRKHGKSLATQRKDAQSIRVESKNYDGQHKLGDAEEDEPRRLDRDVFAAPNRVRDIMSYGRRS